MEPEQHMLFRDHPNQCTGLFDTDEIATAIKCIYTDFHICLSVCYFFYFMFYFVYDFNNNNNNNGRRSKRHSKRTLKYCNNAC